MDVTSMSFDLLLHRPATVADVLRSAAEIGAFEVPDPGLAAIRGVRIAWPERSIRGVAAVPVARGVAVRLPPLPSAADVELAVAIAADVADRCQVAVDDAGTLRRGSSLRRSWTSARCRSFAEGAAARLLADIDAGGLRVPGVRRDLWIGPELKADLKGSAGGLLACARLAQWPGEPAPFEPMPELHGRARVVTLPSERSVLVSAVDLVSLPGPSPCVVPLGSFVAAIEGSVRRLGEYTWLFDPIPESRWPALRRQLGADHVPVLDAWRPVLAEDQLLPMLRPADSPGLASALCWGLTERDDEVLWVSLVRDEGVALRPLPPAGVEAQRRVTVIDRAVRNLEARLPPWEVDRARDGRITGLTLRDPLAAEALLSGRALHLAHELLGTRALVASAPFRGLLRLQDAYPADPSDVATLARWTEHSFAEAAARPEVQRLSPRLLVVVDGRVQGPLQAGGEERTSEEGSLDMAAVVSASSDSPALMVQPLRVSLPPAPVLHPALASLIVPGLGHAMRGQALEAGAWLGLELTIVGVVALGFLPLDVALFVFVLIHGAAAAHAWLIER